MPGDLAKSIVPLEYGPALEAYEEPHRSKVVQVVFLFVFGVLCFAVPTQGFEWLTSWWAMCIVVGLPLLQYRKALGDRVLAGARWVQQRDKWVSTYELARIRSTTVGLYRAMNIKDIHGNNFILVLHDAQMNPRLWDLVYNGILHSVTHGDCDISNAARRILKV